MSKTYNLADLFEMVVDTVPADREALICGESRVTFQQLESRANQLAHYLQSRGVVAGDHVGLYMYNCNEYLEAVWACFKIRAVPVNVNFRYVKDELLYLFDNADMVAVVHGREFIPAIDEVRAAAPRVHSYLSVDDHSDEDLAKIGAVEYEVALADHSTERDFADRSEDDLFILYTGGTTGMPKGVMWPHVALFFAAMGGGGFYHGDGPCRSPEDIVVRVKENFPVRGMVLAPLMHGACWWSACISALAGHTIVLNPGRSLDGEQVWGIVEEEKVNSLSFVGDAMGIPLMDSLNANPDRWDLSSIFTVGSGGAVFSESLQEKFKEKFEGVMVMNTFGSSESGQMGHDSGKDSDGLMTVEQSDFMSVIGQREDGSHYFVEPGSDDMGIFSRSGHISLGYYNDPVKTAEVFIELEGKRWMLTGDAARVDASGVITLYGRGSNCINSGGEKIFPEEVEQAVKSHPSVFDVLVVAAPDDRFGEKVAAVVHLREEDSLTLAELQAHCRQHISGYKLPRALHVTGEIARAPSGKPNYAWAKEVVLSGDHTVA